MKGIVFNILESFITENWGAATYDEILALCPQQDQAVYVAPGTYPDEDLTAIVTQAVEKLGVPLEDALRAFGKYAFPHFAASFPGSLDHESPKDFLKSVESVIHTEVRKLYPDAQPPEFVCEDPAEDRLIMHYRSKRGMCPLVEGLLAGVAEHFEYNIAASQTKCTHRGDDECVFDMTFSAVREEALVA